MKYHLWLLYISEYGRIFPRNYCILISFACESWCGKRQLSRRWQVLRSTMPSLHLFTLISGFPCQEEPSSPPNHWRLRTSKKERGYRDWNYHYMIDVSFFISFLKNKNFEKADADFLQSRQIDHICDEVVSGQHWSSEIFWNTSCNVC